MMREAWWVMALAGALPLSQPAPGAEITTEGKQLARVLDRLDVEHLWLSKRYVNWKTGEPLDRPVTDGKPHTHCSQFVAAACMKLGVYILRPPEHSATLLANAQFDWLGRAGKQKGWFAVQTADRAQRLANRGYLVVAAYKSRDPKKSGHIAIVRPNRKGEDQVADEGPQVIQAGMTNYRSTSLKQGFKAHPTAWAKKRVRFYAHSLKWKQPESKSGNAEGGT
jgi:hypothetical protein